MECHWFTCYSYPNFKLLVHCPKPFINTFYVILMTYRITNVSCIHYVFDRYDALGIQNLENLLRSKNNDTSEVIIENASTKIPRNTNDFLCNTKNKLVLVQFLCQQRHFK